MLCCCEEGEENFEFLRLPFFLLLKFNARVKRTAGKRVVGRGVMCRFECCVVVTREKKILNF